MCVCVCKEEEEREIDERKDPPIYTHTLTLIIKKPHTHTLTQEQLGDEIFPGLYPEWDENHPIHLIGHSFGGMTIRLLLHYLEKQAFLGFQTSPEWVKSMTTINSPHNGTHLVYGLGT